MSNAKPFRAVLGGSFALLPVPVRRLHDLDAAVTTEGRAEVAVEPGVHKALLRRFAGLPEAGSDVPVAVRFTPLEDGSERWSRDFAGRPYTSRMEAGTGIDSGLLIEHFGIFDLVFALEPRPEGLCWRLVRWRWLGLPLPAWSCPRIDCVESGQERRYCFDINVAFPFLGAILRYKGWLEETPNTRDDT